MKKTMHSGSFKIADGVDVTKFDSRQAASAKLAAEMSAALGVDIVLYQDSNPRRFGYYSKSADAIFLNVNARWGESVNAKFGEGGASMMAFTLSHELVHRAKVGSPLKFRSFAQYLIREYNKAGVSVDALVAQQIVAAEKAGVPISEDAAFEEVVCDACQRMLTDTDAGKKLAQWGSRSKSNSEFLQTVRDILTELLDNLRRLFKDVTNDSDAARAFRSLDKNVQQILADMFVDMSTDAAEKLSTIKAAGMLDKINTTGEGGVRYKIESTNVDISPLEQAEGEQVADFIDQVNSMMDKARRSKRKLKIGPLSQNHTRLITNIMQEKYPGFNADGYTLWVDGTFAVHLEERHGQNGDQDKTMSNRDAKVLIPWAAQNATSAEFLYKDGKQRFSDRFFNKDNSKAPEIRLSKKINGNTYYVSECVPDSANKIVWITSAYITKSSTGQLLNIEDDSSPQPTPEATFDSSATKNKIAQNKTVVKQISTTDSDYMGAVKRGNMETAQRMVDQAAADTGAILGGDGKPLKLYRGTYGGQTTFAKKDTYGGKIYTIDNINVATRYGDKSGEATEIRHQTEGEKTTYALYGFPKKMLTIDAKYGVWSDLAIPEELRKYADGRYKATNAEIADWAEQAGYDALRIDNVRDGSFDHGSEVIFFNENAVKSADPITYDDNGNVIPLSERFTESKNDLRYKVAAEDVDVQKQQKTTAREDNGEKYKIGKYWQPDMSKTERAEVRSLAKNEVNKTDNYLGIDSKWLYSNEKGHEYFALYSTIDSDNPTILYACKDNRAKTHYNHLMTALQWEEDIRESINGGTKPIIGLLNSIKSIISREVQYPGSAMGTGSNNGNATVHSRNKRIRLDQAFINCIRNIEEVQKQYGLDDHYQFAVDRGDMKTAQQMVYEAADKAGYSTYGYHGSRTPGFTVVEKYSWLWLARDKSVAETYGTHSDVDNIGKPHSKKGIYNMVYNLGNNLQIEAYGNSWGELPINAEEYPGVYADEETGDITTNAMAEWAEHNYYDSITFVNVLDGGGSPTTVDVIFNPNRDAKSADPVTYDDDGNVIPLSERFNPEKNDIRHKISGSEDLSDATILSRVSGENLTPGQKRNLQLYRERLAKVEEQKKAVEKVSDELSKVRQSNDPGKEAKIRSLRIQLQKEKNRLKIHTDKID